MVMYYTKTAVCFLKGKAEHVEGNHTVPVNMMTVVEFHSISGDNHIQLFHPDKHILRDFLILL